MRETCRRSSDVTARYHYGPQPAARCIISALLLKSFVKSSSEFRHIEAGIIQHIELDGWILKFFGGNVAPSNVLDSVLAFQVCFF